MNATKPPRRGLFGHGSLLDNIRAAQQSGAPETPPLDAPAQGRVDSVAGPGGQPPAAGDRKLEHPLLTGLFVLLTIGGLILLSQRAIDRVQGVVQEYVSALREGDAAAAYDMVSPEQRTGSSLEQWQRSMYTDLLARSTGLDIGRSQAASAGKGCVVLSVEHDGKRVALTFFVAEEKYIHAVYANQDFNGSPGPWNCD